MEFIPTRSRWLYGSDIGLRGMEGRRKKVAHLEGSTPMNNTHPWSRMLPRVEKMGSGVVSESLCAG